VRRLLFGDFGAVLRAGFEDVLRNEEVEVLGSEGHDLLEALVDALPDVVVLDLDRSGTDELIDRVVNEFPAVKVIVCSARLPFMRVYPPFHHGEWYEIDLDPRAFTTVVQA
jgi:DNA-binding NarL/FixJ family response regulator